MSRYSEKLERRREEAAREIEKNEKAARHAAAAAARTAPAPEAPKPELSFGDVGDVPGDLVLDLASVLDGCDSAVATADSLVEVSLKGLAKSEALSVRNSLWAVREKIRGLHQRARRFYVLAKEEACHE